MTFDTIMTDFRASRDRDIARLKRKRDDLRAALRDQGDPADIVATPDEMKVAPLPARRALDSRQSLKAAVAAAVLAEKEIRA